MRVQEASGGNMNDGAYGVPDVVLDERRKPEVES